LLLLCLRKAAAGRLADFGCTTHEIAAVTGHASLREVQRDTRGTDQKHLATSAAAKLKTGTPNGQPGSRLAKKGKNLWKIKRWN
jgi:hypothetical protein